MRRSFDLAGSPGRSLSCVDVASLLRWCANALGSVLAGSPGMSRSCVDVASPRRWCANALGSGLAGSPGMSRSCVDVASPRRWCANALGSGLAGSPRSEEHTSELQSLMRISYAVFCFKKQNHTPLVALTQHDHD